ncbi:MAG: ABC transporter ATP-binding protein, partial [Pseudomonadota bacterium]
MSALDVEAPAASRERADAGADASPMISLRNIRRTFRSPRGDDVTTVLKGVDFSAPAGSFNVIRGESGSGKTTLLRVLGMLDSGYDGSYALGGTEVSGRPDWWLDEVRAANIGFIFQDGQLLAHMTLADNIAAPVRLLGDEAQRRSAADDVAGAAPVFFTQAELSSGLLNAKPTLASGGQKQRAAVMRSIVHQPCVILADEPTASLDAERKQEIRSLLMQMCEAGHTVVVVTHDSLFFDVGRQFEMVKGRLEDAPPGTPVAADETIDAPRPRIPEGGAG